MMFLLMFVQIFSLKSFEINAQNCQVIVKISKISSVSIQYMLLNGRNLCQPSRLKPSDCRYMSVTIYDPVPIQTAVTISNNNHFKQWPHQPFQSYIYILYMIIMYMIIYIYKLDVISRLMDIF